MDTFGFMSMDGYAVVPSEWPHDVGKISRVYPKGGPDEPDENADIDGLQLV